MKIDIRQKQPDKSWKTGNQ